MRDLKDFSAKEWLWLTPLKHAFKQNRDDVMLAAYKKKRAAGLDLFLKQTEQLSGQNIALVIAFEQPWALDWLLRMAARHLTDTTVLVFDNSRRTEARRDIERVCRTHDTPYLALPANPTRHVNRSHGRAMTWIFHNVVHAIKPRMFAFLDHDMIPIQNIKLSERLTAQPFFGSPVVSAWAWQLWAGYCMFDFSKVVQLPMNFLHNFSQGLDTGGRNWGCLYQNFDRSKLQFADSHNSEIKDPVTGEIKSVQIVDGHWLHIGGIGYNDNFRTKMEFCEHLAQALEQGSSWLQLCDKHEEPA